MFRWLFVIALLGAVGFGTQAEAQSACGSARVGCVAGRACSTTNVTSNAGATHLEFFDGDVTLDVTGTWRLECLGSTNTSGIAVFGNRSPGFEDVGCVIIVQDFGSGEAAYDHFDWVTDSKRQPGRVISSKKSNLYEGELNDLTYTSDAGRPMVVRTIVVDFLVSSQSCHMHRGQTHESQMFLDFTARFPL